MPKSSELVVLAASCCFLLGHPTFASEMDEFAPGNPFDTDIPAPASVAARQLRPADERYLKLLEHLAHTTVRLSTSSVRTEAIERQVWRTDEGSRHAEDPWYVADQTTARWESTGDSRLPYRVIIEEPSTLTRTRADEERWHSVSESRDAIRHMQRAWGGHQMWHATEYGQPSATLLPASVHHQPAWGGAWESFSDVEYVARLLAAAWEAGAPDAITPIEFADGKPGVRLQWHREHSILQIDLDPARDHTPQSWTSVGTVRFIREFLVELDSIRELAREGLDDMDLKERLAAQAFLAVNPDRIRSWVLSLPTEARSGVRFAPWRHRSDGSWVPTTTTAYLDVFLTDGGRVAGEDLMPGWAWRIMGLLEEDIAIPDVFEHELRLTLGGSANGATPPFVPPPGYEAYEGQEWIDMVVATKTEERTPLVESLTEGVVWGRTFDVTGEERWIVEDVDLTGIGEWPLEPGDLLLLLSNQSGMDVTQPMTTPAHESPIQSMAPAIYGASYETPMVIRLARNERIVDIVLWSPEDSSTTALAEVHDAMITSHEYLPMEHERAVAFAEAVLAALDD